MDDMVSRQAAIDAIKTWGLIDGLAEGQAIEILADEEKLPSAKPEQTVQEILNYLDTELHPLVSPEHWNVYSELHDMISNLPSAQPEQPEIVRCKECKYYRKDHGWNCIEYMICDISPIHKVIRKPDDYCSRAERRTDV